MRFTSVMILIVMLLVGYQCTSSDSDKDTEAAEANLSPEERELVQGKRIFKNQCVNCHGLNGKMGFNGAKDLTETQLSFEERKILIAYGKGSMMAFKSILSPEEIHAVARYSMTFSEEDEK
ncbi:MAG: c-type cytochrome [Bacteroidetes bacterium]|jgi:mono/diheme cytochrome c family protein|nr:c-type cytochrome [Bacteroidota bacterium]